MQNPPNGAVIRYYLAEEPEEDVEVTLTFADSRGRRSGASPGSRRRKTTRKSRPKPG